MSSYVTYILYFLVNKAILILSRQSQEYTTVKSHKGQSTTITQSITLMFEFTSSFFTFLVFTKEIRFKLVCVSTQSALVLTSQGSN